MFPFADDKDAYWTGFYTTRPQLKRLAKEVSGLMHSSLYMRSMFVFSSMTQMQRLKEEVVYSEYNMLDTLGILQHHDAITGTASSHNADDYYKRLFDSSG